MRGQTRAELIEGDDGRLYVIKFKENPIGVRVLINELVCAYFLQALGIQTPQPACIIVDDEFVTTNSGPGGLRVRPSTGPHYGSAYPFPTASVYDFIPDALLSGVVNRADFFGMLVFDQWVSQADARQAIFHGVPAPNKGWVVLAIDHEQAFQGADWRLRDSSIQGLYTRRIAYGAAPSSRDTRPWIERIMNLPSMIFEEALGQIPCLWLKGQEMDCSRLLQKLALRRERLTTLVRQAIRSLSEQAGRTPPHPAKLPPTRVHGTGFLPRAVG